MHSIDFIETEIFKVRADQYLGEIQLRALRSLLASDPLAGAEEDGYQGLFRLKWSRSIHVLYLLKISDKCNSELNVLFVAVDRNMAATRLKSLRSSHSANRYRDQIIQVLSDLRKAGYAYALKEFVEWLISKFP